MGFSFRDLFNNNRITVTPYGLLTDKIQGELRIAHVSDLHEKRFGDGNCELFEAVASLKPDLIAITGDLVAHENQPEPDLVYTRETARGLVSIAPSFFVTGNHERRFAGEISDVLAEEGVRVLHENVETLHIRGNNVHISGTHDPSLGVYNPVTSASKLHKADGYSIFLTHRPELFEAYRQKDIDLVLAGHTHAGQIRIPAVSSLYMMGQGFLPRYMEGEFTDADTTMIISRGLGSSGYPTVRINNPPDLVAVQVEGTKR